MSTRVTTENSAHENVSLLLPWYVNGTLGSGEKTIVEEHVRSCIVCRRALLTEHRTLDVFRNASPLDQSVQAGFERLQSSIAAHIHPRSRKTLSSAARVYWNRVLDMVRSFTGVRLRSALVAASLAAMALGFALTQFAQQQPLVSSRYEITGAATATDGYHTLSNPVVGAANPDDVQVIFSRGTSTEMIEGLLNVLPAKIIDGPNSAGVYTLRLVGVSTKGERQAAIFGLRDRPQVIFAEAAQPLSVPYQGMAQPQ